jgi:hypothetical protein
VKISIYSCCFERFVDRVFWGSKFYDPRNTLRYTKEHEARFLWKLTTDP